MKWKLHSMNTCEAVIMLRPVNIIMPYPICTYIQWNLRITDTFGTHCFLAILSFVERLSFIEYIRNVGKSPFGALNLVLCSEVISIVSFISEVPL